MNAAVYLQDRLRAQDMSLQEIVSTRELAKYHFSKYQEYTNKLKGFSDKLVDIIKGCSDRDIDEQQPSDGDPQQ